MIKIMKAMIAALIALAVVAAAGVALAQEEEAPEGDSGQEEGATPEGRRGRFGPKGRVLEGDIKVLDDEGNVQDVHFVNGEISNVTDSGFTLTKADESTVDIEVNDATEIFPPDTELADLDGKRARVVTESADSNVATKVIAKHKRGHGPHRGPRPDNGGGSGGDEADESSFRGPPAEGFTL